MPPKPALAGLRIQEIRRIEFYKTDQIATDLICCDIQCRESVFHFHEEEPEWSDLIHSLCALDGFRDDWFVQVSQPAFAESRFVAFESNSP